MCFFIVNIIVFLITVSMCLLIDYINRVAFVCFSCTGVCCFIGASQILCLQWIAVLWQPYIEQVSQHHFSNSTCSLPVSVSHFGNSCNYFKLVHYYNCYGSVWSVIFGVGNCFGVPESCWYKTANCCTNWPVPLSLFLAQGFPETTILKLGQ